MVAKEDVCESCGGACRSTTTRFADGSRWEMCHQCTRQWLLIWRFFCERQPRQANRVRAQANSDSLVRTDGGRLMTDGGQSMDGTDQNQLTETTGNPQINSGPREAQAHPGIDGSWHRYGSLEWWDPENLYDDDYARPICPVSECASGDDGHECRSICERLDVDREISEDFVDVDGTVGGAWYCMLHGWFRVFDYPTATQETEQSSLVEVADGGNTRSVDTATDQGVDL